MVVSSRKSNENFCRVDGRTVMGEESEEGWAEHKALWCTFAQDQCGGYVVKHFHYLRPVGSEVLNPVIY